MGRILDLRQVSGTVRSIRHILPSRQDIVLKWRRYCYTLILTLYWMTEEWVLVWWDKRVLTRLVKSYLCFIHSNATAKPGRPDS